MRNYYSLFFLLVIVSSCASKDIFVEKQGGLTIAEAQTIYQKEISILSTKSTEDYEQMNFFFRKDYQLDWKKSVSYSTDDVESVDVPVESHRKYYVLSVNNDGFFLTWCHHSITIVKDKGTGKTKVFNHFFIPFDDTFREINEFYLGELYRGFHNNGFRDGYSGIELFSTLSGSIVKYIRYQYGDLRYSVFAGSGRAEALKINALIKHFIIRGYGFDSDYRTKTTWLCPACEQTLQIAEGGYLYCANCGWNEMDFWEQTLEGVTIYGDGGGNSAYPDPDDPELPEIPNPGGGNGSQGNGAISGFYDALNLDENAEQYILPTLNLLLEDCAGENLLEALSGYSINVEEDLSFGPLIGVITHRNNSGEYTISKIKYCLFGPISNHKLFEELYHCFQIISGDYSSEWKLNVEIEAKYAAYLYVLHSQNEDYYDSMEQSYGSLSPFENYRIGVSSYDSLAEFIRNTNSTYSNYPDLPNHRTMNGLSQIFDCYE